MSNGEIMNVEAIVQDLSTRFSKVEESISKIATTLAEVQETAKNLQAYFDWMDKRMQRVQDDMLMINHHPSTVHYVSSSSETGKYGVFTLKTGNDHIMFYEKAT